ncbi:MAG TPA: hypothetical protein VF755_01050 [Catenuloplanes sp.]|jgi:hypothetical protein
MKSNPTGYGATISVAAKAVLVALVAVGALPWDDATVGAVALAVAALVDLTIYLGLVRPCVTPVAAPKDNNGTPLVPVYNPANPNTLN